MKDETKYFIDKALEEVQKVYPEIQEIHLEDDLEIGVDIRNGESVYIFYQTFEERGQKFGGPLNVRDEEAVVRRLVESTLRYYGKEESK